jgi:hypothetical protein
MYGLVSVYGLIYPIVLGINLEKFHCLLIQKQRERERERERERDREREIEREI